MSLHDTLTQNPVLVDELLTEIDRRARAYAEYEYGLPRDVDDPGVFRRLVLAWVRRVEERK